MNHIKRGKMSAISVCPIAAATFNLSQSRKTNKISKNFAKRLDFRGDFNSRKSISWFNKRINQNIMRDFKEDRASTSDDGFEVFEQEAFVDGSLKYGVDGLEATLNSLSKWLVAALFAAVVVWRRDAEALWAAMGAVLNVILSVTLKQILNQERPFSTLRSDPGMPSSHAQSVFYTITFLNLSMLEWFGLNALTISLGGLFVILGSYFSWLRVSQQLHTVMQVFVGAVIGSIFSMSWYWSWKMIVFNLFVSSLWIRAVVILGAVGLCVGFILHVVRKWIGLFTKDDH